MAEHEQPKEEERQKEEEVERTKTAQSDLDDAWSSLFLLESDAMNSRDA